MGKTYIACNASAFDLDSTSEAVVRIDKAIDDGVILFMMPDEERKLPVVSSGNDDAEMKTGTKLDFVKPADVTVIMFNDKLSMVYNSHNDESMSVLCDGYVIFANDGPMDFRITVEKARS